MNTPSEPGSWQPVPQPPTMPPAPVPAPSRPPTPAGPGSAPTPAGAPSSRSWLRKWRRTTQPTPTDYTGATSGPGDDRISLLYRNPFQIGFFLTIGALTAYGLVFTLISLRAVLVLVMLSMAIALGLNPLVEWLYDRKLKRGLAVLVVALGAVAILALAIWALVPVLTEQINKLLLQAPGYLENLRQNEQIAAFDAQFKVIEKAVQFLTSGELISSLFGGIVGAGQAVAGTVFSMIITLVLTLWFLATLPALKEVIYQLAPASRRPRVRYLANEMFKRVSGYVSGLFLVVLIAMTVAFVFLSLVGMGQYALALAVVVGLFAFVPLVGTTISMIVVSIIAFSFSPTTGLITLVFFLAYQQFDAYVIQPRVFSHSVQLPAVLVILAAFSGYLLQGMVGAILAIPTMAALLILYQEVLVPHLDRK